MSAGTALEDRRWRREVPKEHRTSIDTRLRWLWNQRFGVVQSIWRDTPDPLDRMACNILLQAGVAGDLNSVELLFKRLEGGAQGDVEVADSARAMRL